MGSARRRVAVLLRLVDVPEDRRRRAVEHAGERFPPRARYEELPERDIDHLVIGFLLDVGSELLLLLRSGRAGIGVFQLLDLGVFRPAEPAAILASARSEEHTSELQSQSNLVCRLLLEKKTQQ